MPMVAIGGPPPPKDSFGQERPPPSPPKPRLKPVIVSPHCTLPRREVQVCCTRLQIFPSTACSRLAGLSRLVTRLSPTPLKKLSRQVSEVTLGGAVMLLPVASMRALSPLTPVI